MVGGWNGYSVGLAGARIAGLGDVQEVSGLNSSGATWNWVLFPSDDSSCAAPTPGHWASFSPFFGAAPSGIR